MSLFKGHELSIDDNPVIGVYETTSGCNMSLLPGGFYFWKDTPDAPTITGTYEIFEGTADGRDGAGGTFALESDTGPLYTVIVTFMEGQGASPGTIQVFDYYSEEVYRVTDLFNDIWFEATRIA